jgi:hypothetical protein
MSLYQIVLKLARNPGFPDGDDNQGYTIVAPLDSSDHLDPDAWRENRKLCTVIRFKPGEDRDADGLLTHNGTHWFFHYDEAAEGEDEPVFRLGEHRLALGDYVTIYENDGQALTYRVSQCSPFRLPQSAVAAVREGAQ